MFKFRRGGGGLFWCQLTSLTHTFKNILTNTDVMVKQAPLIHLATSNFIELNGSYKFWQFINSFVALLTVANVDLKLAFNIIARHSNHRA